MKEKQKKILIDTLIVSIVMLLTSLLPYATYTYKKVNYSLMGIEFIMGKIVCGGKATIGLNTFILLGMLAALAIGVIAIIYSKLKPKIAAGFFCLFSIIIIISNIKLGLDISSILENAKNVKISYGSIIAVLLGIVTLCRGLYILKQENVLSALDFMVLPGMLYFIINNYIPMVGISIAFKKIDYRLGIWDSPWTGFDNFKMLFSSSGSFFESDAWLITRNTLLYNIAFIIIGTIMGIVVGICLADIFSKSLQKFFQTSILLPQLISMVIVAYIVYALLSNETGMINKMIGDGSINFYADKKYWPFILVFIFVWKQIGYNAIIFLSSIVSIDKSIYEASRVDGANKLQTISKITLPMLKPTIITLTMLQVGRIFYSDFGLFYLVPMNSGALYPVTNTIDTYVYRGLMVLNNISTASAASTYQAIIGFVLILTVNLIVRRVDKENALF
jgi:ABC-type polysaccharide transport system permease subunit